MLAACNAAPPQGKPDSKKPNMTNDSMGVDSSKIGLANKTRCFLKASGMQGKDTTFVTLSFADNNVTGEMTNSIYEKDSRKGTLKGKLIDQTVKAVWTFMQEGQTDTLNVEFRLEPKQLAQRPLTLNAKTGREQTDYRSTQWISLPEVNCGAR